MCKIKSLLFLLALGCAAVSEAQSPPASTTVTGYSTSLSVMNVGNGDESYAAVSAAYAPSGPSFNQSGSVDWTLSVLWTGFSNNQPTATGTAIAGFELSAAAGAGSHVNCSASSTSNADSVVKNKASVTGAGVDTPGTNSAGVETPVDGSLLDFELTEEGWLATVDPIRSTDLESTATASAPVGSKGSSATASASVASTGNSGIVSNTLEVTGN